MKKFDLGLVRLATLALAVVAVAGCGSSPELGAAQPLAPEVVAETPQDQVVTTRGLTSGLSRGVTLKVRPGREKELEALMRSQGVEPGTKGLVMVADYQLSAMFMPQSFYVQTSIITTGTYLDDFYLKASADYNLNPGPVEYKATGHFGWSILRGIGWFLQGTINNGEFDAIYLGIRGSL